MLRSGFGRMPRPRVTDGASPDQGAAIRGCGAAGCRATAHESERARRRLRRRRESGRPRRRLPGRPAPVVLWEPAACAIRPCSSTASAPSCSSLRRAPDRAGARRPTWRAAMGALRGRAAAAARRHRVRVLSRRALRRQHRHRQGAPARAPRGADRGALSARPGPARLRGPGRGRDAPPSSPTCSSRHRPPTPSCRPSTARCCASWRRTPAPGADLELRPRPDRARDPRAATASTICSRPR